MKKDLRSVAQENKDNLPKNQQSQPKQQPKQQPTKNISQKSAQYNQKPVVKPTQKQPNKQQNQSANLQHQPNASFAQLKMIEDIKSKYGNKSQGDLMSELMQAVSMQKANGTFSPQALEQIANTAGTMLNGDQKKRMQDIITKIK